MPTRTVEVVNKLGLHARPAALFVQVASRYRADVFVTKLSDNPSRNGTPFEANGKSIMGVMMLQAEPGARLVIRADGSTDAEAAVDALVALVESRFGED